jgi:heme-degrading monooxygenase HmoA
LHARVTTLTMDPARIDDATEGLEREDIPRFKQLDGFKGFTVLADRSSGKAIAVSFWESEEAMAASEEAVAPSRERAASAGGASQAPTVERLEVVIDTMV